MMPNANETNGLNNHDRSPPIEPATKVHGDLLLIQDLRQMQESGLLLRKDYRQVPLKRSIPSRHLEGSWVN